jgi:hypothetical protein
MPAPAAGIATVTCIANMSRLIRALNEGGANR